MSRLVIDRRGEGKRDDGPLLVEGVLLTPQDIAAEVANFPAPSPAESWRAAREAFILRIVLRRRAEALGLAATPRTDPDGRSETEEDALLRALLDAEVAIEEPGEAEIAAFHAAHADRFAALAGELSACSSGAQGGRLGQIVAGETEPAFEAALRLLPEGGISEPVETRHGAHVIRLERRVEGAVLPYAAVRPRIEAYLSARAAHRATAAYLARLMAAAEIRPAEAPGRPVLPAEGDNDAWMKLVGDLNRAVG